MKLFNRNTLALLASVSLLASCSDDVLVKDNETDNAEGGIVFYVPMVPEGASGGSSTRALGNINDFNLNEAAIYNLRVFTYRDGSETPEVIDLLQEGRKIETGVAGYVGYRLGKDIDNGEYEMYAVANNTSLSNTTTKTELLKATAGVSADLKDGLPMSCSNADMEVTYGASTTSQKVGNGTIKVQAGNLNQVTIKANLRFACAKVRMTLVNDARPSDLMGEVKLNNHPWSAALFAGQNVAVGMGSSTMTGKYYTLNPADIPTTSLLDMKIEKDDLQGKEFVPAAGNTQPYIWQTIFYVPERLVQTAENCTSLTMGIGGGVTKKIGTDADTSAPKIERAKFYDYVGGSNGEFKVDVQIWEPIVMAGSLNGEYWLKVDRTSISVSAGFKSQLNYQTNAPDVTLKCEQYNGQDIYTFTKSNGVITVTLNPEIDREEFGAIKSSGAYKYFTITAGTIVKKISVANFDYTEFINDDTMFTLDVNERKSSGDYSNSQLFTLNSNLRYVKFEKVTWVSDADAGETGVSGSAPSLQLQQANQQPLAFGVPIAVDSNGEINFRIAWNGLNSNRALWQKNHDLKVVAKGVDASGNIIHDANGNEIVCTIMIYVRASYDTYTIHLYAPAMNHPHIFVYQILQLPGDMADASKRNKPVGHHKDYAALEYDFTGAVAFKGWYVGDYNNPNNGGHWDNNFWIFDDGTSWNPTSSDFSKHYNRVDFCQAHRNELRAKNMCTDCTKNDFGMNWPGIHMLPDNETGANWWKFELSGVADPGKALIMFTDCSANSHTYGDWMDNESGKRYPKKEQPGVALFDYPTKEGYFKMSGDGALSFQPEATTTSTPVTSQTTSTFEVGKTYAINFNTSTTVWVWTVNSNGTTVEEVSKTKSQSWPGSNYNKVYTFTPTKSGATQVKVIYGGDSSKEHPTSVSSFKLNSSTSRYEATINP